jgi:RNase P/RNase MRP subunit POP5
MSAGHFTNTAPFTKASHWFLLIRVHASTLDSLATAQQLVRTALRDACGEMALSTWRVDVLHLNASRTCAVLRCEAAHVVALRAALTLHTAFRVDVVLAEPTLALIHWPRE